MSADIVKREEAAVTVAPGDLLTAIARAASDPSVDVVKMQALYAMHKEMVAEQRAIAFDAALSRVQGQLPQFIKATKAKNSMFTSLEDIDKITKPLLIAEGFSQTCSEESSTETTGTFVFTLSREGHAKSVRKTFSIDRAYKSNTSGAPIRPAIQDDGSTIHYATRYLLKMILGIVEKGADTDGEDHAAITADQVMDLTTMLTDAGANMAGFLKFMGVESLQSILARDYRKAISAIDQKKRTAK